MRLPKCYVIYLGIKLASETVESEGESMQIYKNLTAKKKKSKVIKYLYISVNL